MRNKRGLKDIQGYTGIYIEPDLPRDIRNIQAHIRRLARDNPGVEIRRGRLVDKTDQHNATMPQHVQPNNSQTRIG